MMNMRAKSDQTDTITVVENLTQSASDRSHLVLHLRACTDPEFPVTQTRRVTFTADTVDNEHLGRLKSNCCCIYIKPRQWDDPSTWEQNEYETEHCRGHTIPIEPQQKPKQDTGKTKLSKQ